MLYNLLDLFSTPRNHWQGSTWQTVIGIEELWQWGQLMYAAQNLPASATNAKKKKMPLVSHLQKLPPTSELYTNVLSVTLTRGLLIGDQNSYSRTLWGRLAMHITYMWFDNNTSVNPDPAVISLSSSWSEPCSHFRCILWSGQLNVQAKSFSEAWVHKCLVP